MTATAEVPAQEQATEQVEEIKFPDEMAKMSFETLTNLIKSRNAKVAEINASKGDAQSLMETLRETSESPEAVAAREARDKAQAELDEAILALDKAVRPLVKEMQESAGDTKDAEAEVTSYDGQIKPGSAFFKKMYGEELAKRLPSLVRIKGFSTRGAGASGRRVRGFSVDVTTDDVTEGFDNLASAAKYLDLDTSQLQEAFFKAAGLGDNGKLKEAPDRVDFSVEYVDTDEDGNEETKTANLVATRDAKVEAEPDEDESESESDESL